MAVQTYGSVSCMHSPAMSTHYRECGRLTLLGQLQDTQSWQSHGVLHRDRVPSAATSATPEIFLREGSQILADDYVKYRRSVGGLPVTTV